MNGTEPVITETENGEKDVLRERNNVVPMLPRPRMLAGGPPPSDLYWLKQIPEMYAFYCRPKPTPSEPRRTFMAMRLIVVQHTMACTTLFDTMQKVEFPVVTNDFSTAHECLEVIPIVYPEEEQEEVNYGPSELKDGS